MLRRSGAAAAALVTITLAAPWPGTPCRAARPDPPASSAPASPDSIRAWVTAGRVALADSMARALLAWTERTYGSESVQAAEALGVLVEELQLTGKGAEPGVRELAVRDVQAHRLRFGEDDPRTLSARENLGIILEQSGDFPGARDTLRTLLAAKRRVLGSDAIPVLDTEETLASVLDNLGDEENARALGEHAARTFERLLPASDPRIGDARTDLANILVDVGDYESARLAYLGALDVYERAYGKDGAQVALALANMARVQYRLGDYTGSRASFERAAAIQEEVARRDSSFTGNLRRLAFTLTFLGETLEALGDYAAARDSLERAAAIRTRVLGATHVLLAPTLIQLADVYKDLGAFEKARVTYDRALEILRTRSGENDPNFAVAMQSQAEILASLGRRAEAESLSARAVRTLEAAYGARHHLTARGEALDATIRFRDGDPAGSAPELERALSVDLDVLGAESPEVASVRALLARVRWTLGERDRALDLALQAEQGARDHLRITGRFLSEREALAYASARAAGLGVALSIAAEGLPDSSLRRVFDSVVRSRAIVLDEMAARNRAVDLAADTTVARLSAMLAAAARRYSNLAVRGPDEDHPEGFARELDAARRDKESAERALAEVSGAVRSEQDEAHRGWSDVAGALPEASCIVSFIRYDRLSRSKPALLPSASDPGTHEYAAFVAEGHGALKWVDLGAAAALEKAVAAWRQEAAYGLLTPGRTASSADRAYRRAGESLRRVLWDPIERALGSARRVFIVPDGAVSFVAFDALPTSPGRYLIDGERVFHYLSAERDLAAPRAVARNTELVAFGGLDFDHGGGSRGARDASRPTAYRGMAPTCGEFREARFRPLPGTAREVEEIARLWRRTAPGPVRASSDAGSSAVLLEGAKGDEASFKRLAPKAGILHVASHGFFLDGVCSPEGPSLRGIGGLVPSTSAGGTAAAPQKTIHPVGSRPTAKPAAAYESPLLLAGLVLAGANGRQHAGPGEEDDILTAEEIAAMDLSGVQWAVLSACDTGSGRATTGEGLLGLRRAFRTAGVGTLIMSLWQADDEGTRRWMRALYLARLQRGLGSADAAREASRASITERRGAGRSTHPFFWAGFVAAGDWR